MHLAYLDEESQPVAFELIRSRVSIGRGPQCEVVVNDRQYFAVAARTFGDARHGDLILYEDSYANVAVAVSRGSAAELLAVDEGSKILIRA